MKKILLMSAAMCLMGTVAFADNVSSQDCSVPGATCSQNNANVDVSKTTNNSDANITNELNDSYNGNSFDMSGSTQNNENTAIGQGGTADATATGNTSTNNNSSNAQIGANNQTNGNISNDVTGGNISSTGGNITGGSLTQGGIAGGSNNQGDITGGSASGGNITNNGSADVTNNGGNNVNTGGNVTGGTAITGSGPATTISGPAVTNGGSANVAGGSADVTNNGGNVTGGQASTNSGNVTSTGGNSTATTGPSTSKVTGSGNSKSQSGVKGSGNSRNNVNTTTRIDASNRSVYKEAANSVILPPVIPNQNDECGIGFSLGGSTTERTVGGGGAFRDKSCAVVKQMERERYFFCSTFGPNSAECASAAYHSSAIGAMAMVESGRVREKSGERQGVVPAKDRANRPTIVKAWNKGEKERAKQVAPKGKVQYREVMRCPATHPVYVEGKGCRK